MSSKYGHLYEKAEIERWINKYHTCPMTDQTLELDDIFPQYAAKLAIDEYMKLKDCIQMVIEEPFEMINSAEILPESKPVQDQQLGWQMPAEKVVVQSQPQVKLM